MSDYIHLNPARARLLEADSPDLEAYSWSSYPAMIGKVRPPDWLVTRQVLDSHKLTARGYAQYMKARVQEVLAEDAELKKECKSIRRGWFLGSEAFRDKLLDYVGQRMAHRKRESYSGEEVRGHDEKAAQQLLEKGLQALKVSMEDLRTWKTTDPRKQALIWLIRSSTLISSDWISQQLGTGHRSNISRALARLGQTQSKEVLKLKKKMQQCKD